MRAIVLGACFLLGSASALADKAPTCGPGEVLVRDDSQKDERGRAISRCVPQKKADPSAKDEVTKPRTPAEERLVAPGPRPVPSTAPSSAPASVLTAPPPPPPPTATPEPAKPEAPKPEPRSAGESTSNSACSAQPGERAAGGLASLLGLLLFAWLARRNPR
jgi:uncharacterized protein (TIGR03382 family)